MKNIYFIFDETGINDFIQMLWCVVIEDDIFFDRLEQVQDDMKLRRQFSELKNNFPHYTEDAHSQRTIVLEEYTKLPCKAYFSLKEYPGKETELSKIYEDDLILLIKPLVKKYSDRYWESDTNFYFLFEELSNYNVNFFENIINNGLDAKEMKINVITKQDKHWATAVIDYACWALSEFFRDRSSVEPTSFWKGVFNLMLPKIWYIKLNLLAWDEFYHFKNQSDVFIQKNHWRFAKK